MSSKIATALHNVMAKVSYVQKDGKNSFHGYKYASEAALLEQLRPAMIEQGLILIPSVQSVSQIDAHGNTVVMMEYTLLHQSGEVWPDKIIAVGCGNDRNKTGNVGDKGVYKAITGANKYLLFKLFQIETGDDPEQTEVAQEAPKQQVKKEEPKKEEHKESDKYVKTFIAVVDTLQEEGLVREFWKTEAKNRSELSIAQGSDSYKAMFDACSAKIAKLKEGSK